MNETILIKTEVPSCLCDGCFYYRPDESGIETCCRPNAAMVADQCFDEGVDEKFYIFKEQNQNTQK